MTLSHVRCVLACVLVGALASFVGAQQEVLLKDGGFVKGRVSEDDGKKIVVQLQVDGGGSGTATYTYDQLAPQTIFRLRLARTPRTDAKEQLALATYAFDNGQWDDARLSFFLADAADKKEGGTIRKDLDALVERAAPVAMQMAEKDVEAGRITPLKRASRASSSTSPRVPRPTRRGRCSRRSSRRRMDEREKKRLAEVAEDKRERAQEIMGPIKKRYEAAQALVREGLNNTRRQTQAIQTFRDAIANFEGVRKDLARTLENQGPKSDFAAHFASWDKMVKNDIIETRLNLASIYFVRSSLQDAGGEVNAALALDSENSDALAMRGRLEVASSEGGRWKW